MVVRGTLGRTRALLGLAAFTALAACGDKVDVKEAANDDLVNVVFEKDVALKVTPDDNFTLTRVVVRETTDRAIRQGSSDPRRRFLVDFFGRYLNDNGRGDTPTSVTRHGQLQNLLSDADGNLYLDGFEPGTVVDNPALRTSGQAMTQIDRWTIAPATALVAKFDWLVNVSDPLVTGTVTNTAITVLDLGEVFGIGNKEGTKNKQVVELGGAASFGGATGNAFISFGGNFPADAKNNDSVFALNKDYTQYQAPVACVLKGFDDATAANQTAATSVAIATAQLNLGAGLLDPDNIINSSDTGKGGTSGLQNLIVNWSLGYHLAGLNWKTGHMTWYKTTSAPIYQNRELPSVDARDTAPAPSGIEAAIRECNGKATKNDQFTLVTRGSAALPPLATYCDGLKTDTDLSKWPLNAFSNTLAGTPYDCGAATAWDNLAPLIVQGNWGVSGTAMAHSGRIANATGATALTDLTVSDIVDSAL